MSGTGELLLGVIAFAVLLMALIQLGAILAGIRLARRVDQMATQLDQDLKPLLANLTALTNEAARTAALAAKQVERFDQVFADFSQRVDQTLAAAQSFVTGPARQPFVLVVVPTRELCLQVARDFEALGTFRRVKVVAVYGGQGITPQERSLRLGAHVVVGTPGRLLDLVNRRTIDLRGIKVLILDEADRLLDLGFLPDVRRIAALLPKGRQTALFSATITPEVDQVAKSMTIDPVRVSVKPEEPTIDTIDQSFIEVLHVDKLRALREILGRKEATRVLVFRRTKRGVDKLARDLIRLGHDAGALHGDIPQRARERVLEGFKNGRVTTLVATNLASRGIHVEGIDHVVNFDLPEDPETYVHRVGRTGRAGERGKALTFVTETQKSEFADLRRKARVPFRQERLALYP